MITLILLFVFLSLNIFSQNNEILLNNLLSYNQVTFNSDTCCWRKLSTDKKYLEAANLMALYIKKNKQVSSHSLNWHTGQMYAMAHSNRLAKKYFKRTYSVFYIWFGNTDAKTWYYYAKGTVAFIDENKDLLEEIIKTWRNKFPSNENLNTLIRLNENWGKSYDFAYNKTE